MSAEQAARLEDQQDAAHDRVAQEVQSASEKAAQQARPEHPVRSQGLLASLLSAVFVVTAILAPKALLGGTAPRGLSPVPGPGWAGPRGHTRLDAGGTPGPAGAAVPRRDPNRVGHGSDGKDRQLNTEHGDRGPASKRIIAGYGFWIFLLSDIIMFSAFFATYAVLSGETAGGPDGRDLFDLRNTEIETGCLLASSFTCGLATIGARARNTTLFYGAMAATFVLGAVFLGLEIHEFSGMVAQGDGPTRSAFLSSFFALVGCHGMHITIGLLWLLTMMAQVLAKGYRADILRRLLCFSLFWHALDIVWVALFTVVYLMGVMR